MKLHHLDPIHSLSQKLNKVRHMQIREVFLPNVLAYWNCSGSPRHFLQGNGRKDLYMEM